MKVVLFAGGQGLRIRDQSDQVPKPMVPIGSRPVLWHVMKWYAHYGHQDFILCLGHRGEAIKRFFLNYDEATSNDFVLRKGGLDIEYHNRDIDDWTISFVDTGLESTIGERLIKIRDRLGDDAVFLANYSDGVTDLDLDSYLAWFGQQDAVASFVSVRPPLSYHVVSAVDSGLVTELTPIHEVDQWINAGYFVFRPEIFDFVAPGEDLVVEGFQRLIDEGKLVTYRHRGFWAPLDTFKEKVLLDDLAASGRAPWEVWKPERNPA
jgi:glucose-1-phosphate cytidylyltransferase